MLIIGLVLLAKKNSQHKIFARNLCMFSATALIVGFLVYYIFFTPMFGLD